MSIYDGGGYKTKVRDMVELREKEIQKRKVDIEEHIKIYSRLREEIRMKTYSLKDQMEYIRENLKLRFWIRDLDLPRRKRYTSSRVEEEDA